MWMFVTSGLDGKCKLNGVSVFDYKWESTGEVVEVADPLYNQKYTFGVYNVNLGNETITFAAGEFSANIYGFYVKG